MKNVLHTLNTIENIELIMKLVINLKINIELNHNLGLLM